MTTINRIEDFFLTFKGILVSKFFLQNSCYWDAEKMESYQYNKLKKLLIESGKNVPYYQDTFKKIGFDPRVDFRSLKDISHVPLLTKSIAREVRPFLDNPRYANKSIQMRTSGSTGEPFQVNVSKNAWVMEQAVVWRHWSWSGYRFRDRMAIVRSYAPQKGEPLIKKDPVRNFVYFSPFHLNDEHIGSYLKEMIRLKVKILRGYPSSVLLLAKFILRTKHPIPRLKAILVASEQLTEDDRITIEEAFETKVTNHYGLAEVCVMMGDCAAHNGLHNYDEHGYLELLDTNNPKEKEIVGTNLHNFATPLIRYQTGDLAKVSGTKSQKSCAHNLTTVDNISGRADQHILTPEDYKIPTVNFYTMFEAFQEIEKWQIVQCSREKIQFVLRTNLFTDSLEKKLRERIYTRLPKSVEIEIKVNEPFVQKFEGKINPFVSQLT